MFKQSICKKTYPHKHMAELPHQLALLYSRMRCSKLQQSAVTERTECCFVISYKYRKSICSPPATEHQSYRQSQSTRSSQAFGQLSWRSVVHERFKNNCPFSSVLLRVYVCERVHLSSVELFRKSKTEIDVQQQN